LCTTNPTFGRGLSLMMQNVADLADTLHDHPDDLSEQAIAMDHRVTENVAPWYEDQAAGDAALMARMRHTVLGAPPPAPPASATDRITFNDLRMAAPVDPIAFRAYFTIMGMLGRPDDTYRDPQLVARVQGFSPRAVAPRRCRNRPRTSSQRRWIRSACDRLTG